MRFTSCSQFCRSATALSALIAAAPYHSGVLASEPATVERSETTATAAKSSPDSKPEANKAEKLVRLFIYTDPRTLPSEGPGGGPNGNGGNVNVFGGAIVDFWWTVGLSDKQAEKYLTEIGFMAEVLDRGDGKRHWHVTTTTPGQPYVDLPAGAWYTFDILFHDNGADGHLAATLSIADVKKETLYKRKFDRLYQDPKTEQLGEVRYSWFTNFDKNMKKVYAWSDPQDEILADKAEVINVATLFPTKLNGGLQDPATSGFQGTGETKPEQWDKMAAASARLAKVYPLIRKETTRVFREPYPEEREAYIDAYTPAGRIETPRTMYLVKRSDSVVPGFDMQAPAPSGELRELVGFVADVAPESVEGGDILSRTVDGDWLFRDGASTQAILDRVAELLHAEYQIEVRITLEGSGATKKVRVEVK